MRFPNRVPYPVWPEPGGVFPWADDQNGNYYLWLTEGNPDEWQVVTNEIRGHGYRAHHCTMTEYLAGIMRGHILPMMSEFPTPEDFVFRASLPPE